MADDFGQHRVVVRRHDTARLDSAVPTNTLRVGGLKSMKRSHRRQVTVRRILCVQTNLDSVPLGRDLVLGQRERMSVGYIDLPTHQIGSSDALGHWMFDLQTRVHLQEVEAAVGVEQVLDSACPDVADRLGKRERRFAHLLPKCRAHRRRRGLFDDLLVPTLDGALALEQMHHVAVSVAEDLDFDVSGARQ